LDKFWQIIKFNPDVPDITNAVSYAFRENRFRATAAVCILQLPAGNEITGWF
jgi:hypothetical protein